MYTCITIALVTDNVSLIYAHASVTCMIDLYDCSRYSYRYILR